MKRKKFMSFLVIMACIMLLAPGVFAQDYQYPLEDTKYHMTSRYGWRIHPIYRTKRFHAGVDLVCSSKYILATKSGKVVSSGYGSGSGNYLTIQHSDDANRSTYMHLSRKYVSTGDKVVQGQIIGYMGQTGAATGVHLHFQLNKSPGYSSTMQVNPDKRKYVYKKKHTHVYTSYRVKKGSKHPHALTAACVCGKTSSKKVKEAAVCSGCAKCTPVITTKNALRTYSPHYTVKWNKVANATGYEYYLYNTKKKYAKQFPTRHGTVKKNTVTFDNLLPGNYGFYVVALDSRHSTKSSASKGIKFYVDLKEYTPEKSILLDGKVYSMFDVSTSWKYAESICKREGGHLAVLDTKKKNDAVVSLIKARGKKKYYFIGASDEKKQKAFSWVDGSKFKYKAFAKGQPSDEYASIPYLRENYVAIDTSKKYAWNDLCNFSSTEKQPRSVNKGFILMTKAPKKAAKPVSEAVQASKSSVRLKWNSVERANKYRIYIKVSKNGKYQKLDETKSTSYTAEKLKFGKTYYFRVYSVVSRYDVDILSDMPEEVSVRIVPYRVKVTLKDESGKKVRVSYSKSENATGYMIFRAGENDPENFVKIKTTSKLYYVDSVKKDRYYYYKILPYYKTVKTYVEGVESDVKEIRYIKTPSAMPSFAVKKSKYPVVNISWKETANAAGYRVYRSTKKTSGFKKIATVKDLGYSDESQKKKGVKYYYKARAYNRKDGIVTWGSYTPVRYISF